MVQEQEAKLVDSIESLVDSVEQFHPNKVLGDPADLERLELSEKVGEVTEKWLERCASIIDQLDEFRGGPKTPALAQKLDDAINRLEEMRRPLLRGQNQ